jgi:hypothetical protein
MPSKVSGLAQNHPDSVPVFHFRDGKNDFSQRKNRFAERENQFQAGQFNIKSLILGIL